MTAAQRAGTVWDLLKSTGRKWSRDEARRLAATLAFYALLSLTPLLVIVVSEAANTTASPGRRSWVPEYRNTPNDKDRGQSPDTSTVYR